MSAGKDPGASVIMPRVLEFAPACKQLALILAALYCAGLFTTWYRVWWDSLFGLFVSVFGYYTLRDTYAELNQKGVIFVRVSVWMNLTNVNCEIASLGPYVGACVCVYVRSTTTRRSRRW